MPTPSPAERLRRLLPRWEQPPGGWVPRQPLERPDPPDTVAQALAQGRWDPARHGALGLVLLAVVAAVVAAVVLLRGRPSEQPLAPPPVVGASQATGGPVVVVDVAGRVRRPGLVRLPAGSRVDDAIRAAGGPLPGTSLVSLNRAARLTDGQQVVVGVVAVPGAGGGVAAGGLLDLNTATAQDLDALPGIGPVLADRIVDWRLEHGRFGSVDQLREVSGIGESKYQALRTKVRV